MLKNAVLERYLDTLLKGDRKACRSVIEESLQTGTPANSVYSDIIWPIMVEIEHLVRSDKISSTQEHLATRINRTIVDQLQNKLPRRQKKNRRVVICCAQDQLQELFGRGGHAGPRRDREAGRLCPRGPHRPGHHADPAGAIRHLGRAAHGVMRLTHKGSNTYHRN